MRYLSHKDIDNFINSKGIQTLKSIKEDVDAFSYKATLEKGHTAYTALDLIEARKYAQTLEELSEELSALSYDLNCGTEYAEDALCKKLRNLVNMYSVELWQTIAQLNSPYCLRKEKNRITYNGDSIRTTLVQRKSKGIFF